MAKKFMRGLSFFLAMLMCISTVNIAVFATDAETIWQGNDAKLNIEKGESPYVYAIAQDPANNRWYYETSNHTVKKEVTGGGAVHIFPMVDTTVVSGDWTPDGIYKSGVSNYDVMYCCDAATSTADGIYYKRVNLEDSEYVSDENAMKLRAILENAYPYVSVEEAKAALGKAGFAQAEGLDRSELIAATQAAIWTIANPDSGDSYRYNKTATTAQKLTWGGYMHEFADEITNFTDSKTSRKYLTNPNDTGDRVNALIDFYLAMEGEKADDGQIVITGLDVSKSQIDKAAELYSVELNVSINHGADENDAVKLDVYINGELTGDSISVSEATDYSLTVDAKVNDVIKVVVSGTQNLERGVYFYIPEPQDIDGDGVATSREVSQNLVGVAAGETPVYAEKSYTVDVVNVDLELTKVNSDKEILKGAKFALFDADGVLVDTQDVDDNGKLVFAGLIPGNYTLKETVAPTGYALPDDAIEVTVKEDGSITFNGNVSEGEKITGERVEMEGFEANGPETTIDLMPGANTSASNETVVVESAAKTVIAVRKVTATMSEVEVDVKVESSNVKSILPALKFDRDDTADQKKQKAERELYTDNGHFHDPDTFTVTDAPEGYPFKYVGHGDYSGHYVSHIRVIYERDAEGNAIVDENGNYVIKELQHASSGAPLYYKDELTTNIIPAEEGKISAVFVKQSTSGMFWTSEEVDDATAQAVIACLKANNPSYKGYNAFAFGEGEHELEFKKNKFVTYTFTGDTAVLEEKGETSASETETVAPEATNPEATNPEAPKPEATKPEAPKPEEKPTLNYTVKGAKVTGWTVIDGVTAIYIKAEGKVPAVIWTSKEVDADTIDAFADELGAPADAKVVSGLCKCSIEYQHNKSKTKTVTYTFSAI